ncbi:TetR/AcrR family transcriptional regulator [Mycobacterium sp.]|uniref:TetR/AcrR family transcriptional regulator n=1 Tax=Mycobacterium sp. TaxID=1785 RepID=UPI002DB0F6FE|nr:TetR/AcrR family transcriptional regulator [Mycobacterium sp.]
MANLPDGFRPNVVSGHFDHEPGMSEDILDTDRQSERRTRILDAAIAVAGAGGYELVHMRDIAEHAGVSLGTLYQYFPSKVHVLVRALERELLRFDDYLSQNMSDITDPFIRLRVVVWRLITAMEQSDRMTEALTHAYVASNVVASPEAEAIRDQTSEMFAYYMSDGVVAGLERHAADLLTDVWTAEILALVQGRRTYTEMRHTLNKAVDLVARSALGGNGIQIR